MGSNDKPGDVEEEDEDELEAIVTKQYKQIFKKVSTNHIYLFYVNYLNKKFNGNRAVIPEYLEQLQAITESNAGNIEAGDCAERILGFSITFETLYELLTFSFGLALFLGQLIFT